MHRSPGSRPRWIKWGLAGSLLVAGGCAPGWYVADADREVDRLLADFGDATLGDRVNWVQYPETVTDDEVDRSLLPGAVDDDADAVETIALDLESSLAIAFETGRDLIDQKEGLYLAGLGYSLTQYNFGPILNGAISYVWNDAEDGSANDALSASVGATSILPTGGRVSVSGSASGSRADDPNLFLLDDDAFHGQSVGVSLRQPLLRGAGYDVSHEPLTQAERSLVYSVRSFELFREDYAIRIANQYFRLVSQKQQLANAEQNYADAVFDREKAEALRQVDRNQDEQVILAKRREIQAEDELLIATTNYESAIDDFTILLGLSNATRVEIVDAEPTFKAVRVDPDSAIEVALANRLDLHTEIDRLEDVARGVMIARDGLRPDLDLDLGLDYLGGGDRFRDALPDEWVASVGVSLELPLDRKGERNAYRSSLIRYEQARRDLDQFEDEIAASIISQLRELRQVEKRIELQKDQIRDQQRAVAVTQIRFDAGDVEARDLLDARQSLLDAQNALIDLKVDHFIARLQLRRDMGIFFVDDKGTWSP